MGLFDVFKKNKSPHLSYAPTQSGNIPFYTDFGSNIYASDIIVQSIRCKANEFKKLLPRHIRTTGTSQNVIKDSSVAKVLSRPNEYMTTADFLEKITILLELNKNVFIYPTFYDTKGGERVFTGLYPLKPMTVEYLQDSKGKMFIRFRFTNGNETTLLADDVIHWRKDYGVNDYFGGSAFGGNDDIGLITMLKRYDMLLQSLSKALECSCKINGIVGVNSYMSNEAMQAERIKFENDLKNNESGILFTDMKTTYTHIPRDIKLIDSETLNSVYKMILRANGTSLAILDGDYTKSQKEAYYEHALEADIKSLGQAMTRTFFSSREESYGNEVVLYPTDIQFMSMENKLSALATGLPAGLFTRNEARALLGFPPIENGDEIPQGYNMILNSTTNEEENEDEQSGAQ